MGTIQHNSMIIASHRAYGYEFRMVYEKAKSLFGDLVTEIIDPKVNGYLFFFIAPNGAKEEYEVYEQWHKESKLLQEYIRTFDDEDGGNGIHFTTVSFGERGAYVSSTNEENLVGETTTSQNNIFDKIRKYRAVFTKYDLDKVSKRLNLINIDVFAKDFYSIIQSFSDILFGTTKPFEKGDKVIFLCGMDNTAYSQNGRVGIVCSDELAVDGNYQNVRWCDKTYEDDGYGDWVLISSLAEYDPAWHMLYLMMTWSCNYQEDKESTAIREELEKVKEFIIRAKSSEFKVEVENEQN